MATSVFSTYQGGVHGNIVELYNSDVAKAQQKVEKTALNFLWLY